MVKMFEGTERKFLFLDFEFSGGNAKFVELICMAYKTLGPECGAIGSIDLREERGKANAIKLLDGFVDHTLVAYGLSAELRALFSLYGTEDLDRLPFFKYICLHAEHRL